MLAVRPEGANYLWRKNPPRELSIDLVADERLGRVRPVMREGSGLNVAPGGGFGGSRTGSYDR